MPPTIVEPPITARHTGHFPSTVNGRRSKKRTVRQPSKRATKKQTVSSSEIFETLIADHQTGVWRYLRALGCQPDLADDLTQETFLCAMRRPFQYLGKSAAGSYLRRSAYFLYMSHIRKQNPSQSELSSIEVSEATWTRWIRRQKNQAEIIDVLKDSLANLPERSRTALIMRYRDNCSREEIAKALSISDHGAKNLMQRAKKKLRESIEMSVNQGTRREPGPRSLTL